MTRIRYNSPVQETHARLRTVSRIAIGSALQPTSVSGRGMSQTRKPNWAGSPNAPGKGIAARLVEVLAHQGVVFDAEAVGPMVIQA